MGDFIVYGYFFGSNDLPEVVAYAQTYQDAELALELAEGYDHYCIATDVGGVRFASMR